MKRALPFVFFTLLFCCPLATMQAQCPGPIMPDFSYCYNANESNTVAFELCPTMAGTTVTAAICQGSFEAGFDDLTVYEGSAGSGTGGTIVLGPVDGNLAGVSVSSSIADNCLIFVINSDGSVSCSSSLSIDELQVNRNNCPTAPTYDFDYCYSDNETNEVAFEICPASAGELVTSEICQGSFEDFFDNLTVYQGAAGSGTSGTILQGPLDGDLAGTMINSTVAGQCLIFVSNSDNSNSCADDNEQELLVNTIMALPVELQAFKGYAEEAINVLEWSTANESNASHFAIERSLDGRDQWQLLDQIAAEGFSSTVQSYRFEDHTPLTKAYYRLRMVDFDRSESHSSILHIERPDQQGFQLLSLYPVPTSNWVTITYQLEKREAIRLTISDLTGRVIRQYNPTNDRGIQTMEMDVSDLAQGLYFVHLENSEERVVKTLVKN